MSCVVSSSRGVVTMKRNDTDLGPIEIIRYFGGVPIFRTQIVFKLKKLILQNVMISMWRMAVVCAFLKLQFQESCILYISSAFTISDQNISPRDQNEKEQRRSLDFRSLLILFHFASAAISLLHLFMGFEVICVIYNILA